jgi:hypothetical protein
VLGNRWDHYYARAKLGSDPLYPGICDALRGTTRRVLDLGCGLGLLAHALARAGHSLAVPRRRQRRRQDRAAQRAARRAELVMPRSHGRLCDVAGEACRASRQRRAARRAAVHSARGAVAHAGRAIAMLVPGAKLVIRTGLADGSGRARVTRASTCSRACWAG